MRPKPNSPYQRAFEAWRERWLQAVLEQHGGSAVKAAKAAGVSRHYFYQHVPPKRIGRRYREWTEDKRALM